MKLAPSEARKAQVLATSLGNPVGLTGCPPPVATRWARPGGSFLQGVKCSRYNVVNQNTVWRQLDGKHSRETKSSHIGGVEVCLVGPAPECVEA